MGPHFLLGAPFLSKQWKMATLWRRPWAIKHRDCSPTREGRLNTLFLVDFVCRPMRRRVYVQNRGVCTWGWLSGRDLQRNGGRTIVVPRRVGNWIKQLSVANLANGREYMGYQMGSVGRLSTSRWTDPPKCRNHARRISIENSPEIVIS